MTTTPVTEVMIVPAEKKQVMEQEMQYSVKHLFMGHSRDLRDEWRVWDNANELFPRDYVFIDITGEVVTFTAFKGYQKTNVEVKFNKIAPNISITGALIKLMLADA